MPDVVTACRHSWFRLVDGALRNQTYFDRRFFFPLSPCPKVSLVSQLEKNEIRIHVFPLVSPTNSFIKPIPFPLVYCVYMSGAKRGISIGVASSSSTYTLRMWRATDPGRLERLEGILRWPFYTSQGNYLNEAMVARSCLSFFFSLYTARLPRFLCLCRSIPFIFIGRVHALFFRRKRKEFERNRGPEALSFCTREIWLANYVAEKRDFIICDVDLVSGVHSSRTFFSILVDLFLSTRI